MIYTRRDVVLWTTVELMISEQEAIQVTRRLSDEDICRMFLFTLLRKGWYARP